jgi:hypothetical protein
MRSSRMRGYGSWCIGWREGERRSPVPPQEPGGCGMLMFLGFMLLVVVSFLKTSFETGNPMGLILGLAVVAGVVKGLSK